MLRNKLGLIKNQTMEGAQVLLEQPKHKAALPMTHPSNQGK
jgi:hypothetical protein